MIAHPGEFGEMKRSVLECTFFKTSSLDRTVVSCLWVSFLEGIH